jgi:hypothetical protein
MKKIFVLVLSILLFSGMMFIQSCDKIEPPYKEGSDNPPDTVEVRKFLLEEYTGHTCPNCPQGAIVAQDLKAVYGERLVIISIHASDEFAAPGTGEFSYDFRSTTGNDIFGFFVPFGFPSGMISRTGWPQLENTILNKNAWGPRIVSLKDLQPTIAIEVTDTWNSGTRAVDATVELDALTDIDATYKIAVYITEDSIIQAQLTENDLDHPDNIIHDYAHRHVLRGSMNGTWGDTLIAGNASSGAQIIKNFSSTLNAGWNEDHCYLVVLVFDADNYEIMQVEEKKIK